MSAHATYITFLSYDDIAFLYDVTTLYISEYSIVISFCEVFKYFTSTFIFNNIRLLVHQMCPFILQELHVKPGDVFHIIEDAPIRHRRSFWVSRLNEDGTDAGVGAIPNTARAQEWLNEQGNSEYYVIKLTYLQYYLLCLSFQLQTLHFMRRQRHSLEYVLLQCVECLLVQQLHYQLRAILNYSTITIQVKWLQSITNECELFLQNLLMVLLVSLRPVFIVIKVKEEQFIMNAMETLGSLSYQEMLLYQLILRYITSNSK